MNKRLLKIYISKSKHDRESVSYAYLNKECGLLGDYKSKSSENSRQLVILLNQDRITIDKNFKNIGLCTSRFKENMLIDGLNLNELKAFTRLKIGKSTIEITSIGKRCFEDCELIKNKSFCVLNRGVIFARVIESGIVKVEDKIEILK